MNSTPPSAFAALRQFVRPRQIERCGLCAGELPPEHPHLLELTRRQITCSCQACALLFAGAGQGGATPGPFQGARYRPIPRDARRLPDFRLTAEQWDDLRIPIDLAFFFHDSLQGRTV